MFILKNQPGKFREKWNETVTHEHTGEIVHRPDDKELGRRIALALSMADTKVIDHAPAEIIEVEDGETD
jgi:hypothetical protein